MIPFLKHAKEASSSGPVDSIKRDPDDGAEDEYDGLEAACEDFGNALAAKDWKAAAAAWRAADEILESNYQEEA